MKYALYIFMALGGFGLIFHLIISNAQEQTKNAILWLAKKYPAIRTFLKEHGPDIILTLKNMELGEEEALGEIGKED